VLGDLLPVEEALASSAHLLLFDPSFDYRLVNERINVLLLRQRLNEQERRGIIETARVIKPKIKCVTFGSDGREVELDGGVAVERLDGPAALVKTIGRMLRQIFRSRLELSFHCVDKMPQSRNVDIDAIPPHAC
jgi:hypothetical protein